jgi:hypothetical protein
MPLSSNIIPISIDNWYEICTFLHPCDLGNLSGVCKDWFFLFRSDRFWAAKIQEYFFWSCPQFDKMEGQISHFGSLPYITLWKEFRRMWYTELKFIYQKNIETKEGRCTHIIRSIKTLSDQQVQKRAYKSHCKNTKEIFHEFLSSSTIKLSNKRCKLGR